MRWISNQPPSGIRIWEEGTLSPKGKTEGARAENIRREPRWALPLLEPPQPLDPWAFWKIPVLTSGVPRPTWPASPPLPSPVPPPPKNLIPFLPSLSLSLSLSPFPFPFPSAFLAGEAPPVPLRRVFLPAPADFSISPPFPAEFVFWLAKRRFLVPPWRSRPRISTTSTSGFCCSRAGLSSVRTSLPRGSKGNRRFELRARLMASMAQVQERGGLDSPGLPIDKRLPPDAIQSPLVDDAMQPKEGTDGYPVKARKPYTITKQREKWTEEEHGKFLEALKLYGRSWRQIQEHIGTKTAVQIRSHAQKFFSKVVREPGASNAIEIPPPRPKRKPLHPYPRKCADSTTIANPPIGEPKNAPISSSSGSDQENGSPVSVLSAMQSDAFGSSVSNPSTGCTSPASSDEGDNVAEVVNGEETIPTQQIDGQSRQELKQDNSDGELSEEDSSRVQETSLKLFGKTVIIPDPKKVCSSDGAAGAGEKDSHSSTQEMLQASSDGGVAAVGGVAAYPSHNGWILPFQSFPVHMYESGDARISPLHIWWPYYGFPVDHPRGFGTGLHNEGASESDTGKSPSVESSSDCVGNAHTTTPTNCKVVKESLGPVESGPSVELKPSVNSAFVRVKPSSGSRDQPIRGFMPYKRCKVE